MQERSADHDRDTGGPDPETTNVALQAALERLRLEGAIFLRAEYREPWAYESMTGPATAEMLRPWSERVILFHVVASGTCWVATQDGEKHWATSGDVIVLPYGDQHRMGGVADAEVVSINSILEAPPWRQMPVIRHGSGGGRTDVICGYLHSQDPLFDPNLRVFPPVFVVRPPAGAAAEWVQANIEYALQKAVPPPSPGVVPTRLPELLLVEVLRLHLASAPAAERGWVAALRDPVLTPALALLHRSPEHKWTVSELARALAVSRSLLDARFRQMLGGARRSATSPTGECTWPKTCWRQPIWALWVWRIASGTTRGGVQPGVQASARQLTRRLACRAFAALVLGRLVAEILWWIARGPSMIVGWPALGSSPTCSSTQKTTHVKSARRHSAMSAPRSLSSCGTSV